MTLLDQGRTPFPAPDSAQTEARIDRLKAGLSEKTVADLAKEALARVAIRAETAARPTVPVPAAKIEELANALCSESPDAAARIVQVLLNNGVSIDSIYLEYLAPASRLLGAWWNEDRASFAVVSIGTSRISGIMRKIGRHLPAPADGNGKSAIFASVPGETHTIGMHMAADLFRSEGWVIDLKTGFSHGALVGCVRDSDSPILGLSAGGAYALPALDRLIRAVRDTAPDTAILVSGPILQDVPDLLSLTGVEAVADDIPSARVALEVLWERALVAQTRRTG